MPGMGDLTCSDSNNVSKRVRAIDALLRWKEDHNEEKNNVAAMIQNYKDNLRKVSIERDKAETKCQKMEERVQNLDKQKY